MPSDQNPFGAGELALLAPEVRSGGESFGCATTAKPFKMSDLSWPVSGVLGLGLVLRVLRIRKNRKPKA